MSARESSSAELPQIFVKDDGRPVKFFLLDKADSWAISDKQIPLSEERIRALTRKIVRHGGIVLSERRRKEADTIIVNETAQDDYRDFYRLERTPYAESPGFVEKCIRSNKYQHQIPAQKAMGGRPMGSTRTNFTAEDERHMAEFIALTIPYPENGGRLGPGVWAWLINDFSMRPQYAWAKRHTIQSWQEHYKKNRERLDEMVEAIVAKSPPPPDGKCLYPYSRKRTKRSLRFEVIEVDDGMEEELPEQAIEQGQEKEQDQDQEADVEDEGADEDAVVELLTPRKRQRIGVSPDEPWDEESARRSARELSIALRQEEEESSQDERDIEWPEDIFEGNVQSPPSKRPGPADAGPSGTARTPSPAARHQVQPQRQKTAAGPSMAPPRSRPRPRPIPPRITPELELDSGIPMSSQATLVAPDSTQPWVPQRRAERPAQQGRDPRSFLRPRDVVSVDTSSGDEDGRGQTKARSAVLSFSPSPRRGHQAVENTDINEENDGEDDDADDELDVVVNSEVVVIEEEEDEAEVVDDEDDAINNNDVEEQAYENLYPNLEEAELLSSDDERTRQSILLSHSRNSSARKPVPGAFPHSPSAGSSSKDSTHHDFSASEDEDEDENEDSRGSGTQPGFRSQSSSRAQHALSPPSPSYPTEFADPVTPAAAGRSRGQVPGAKSVPTSALRGQHKKPPLSESVDGIETRSEGRVVEKSPPIRSPPVTRTYLGKRSRTRT